MTTTARVLVLVAIGAGACAAGTSRWRAQSPSPEAVAPRLGQHPMAIAVAASGEGADVGDQAQPGHSPCAGEVVTAEDLPPGHPPIGSMDQTGGPPVALGSSASEGAPLEWKAPARWLLVPNTNTMRLATYRVPRASGDDVDAELSVVQAGGSVRANAERWIGQFDEAGQKAAKISARKVGALDITVVEVQGYYSGGMGVDRSARSGWGMLGAIVPTAEMPYFFKLTGPARSVSAASAEFDALVNSLVLRDPRPI